jgi:pimeloyl-ACP methyl ester carboxylesterase/DNA-binding winged helix-turn-helix (wHTH) protein
MKNPENRTIGLYQFGRFRLDGMERSLFAGDEKLALAPKVFDTLLMLVENSGRVLSKEAMLAKIWDDSFVEENNLAQNISVLRKVLSETSDSKFIETVPKYGYRFVADVENLSAAEIQTEVYEQSHARIYIDGDTDESSVLPASRPLIITSCTPETRYVRNGDVNIAYQVLGHGDTDIVFVMGWVSHLEYFWKHHLFASFLERLASFSRLILFDKRGTGLSDRVPNHELPTLEQRMEDEHAVMDAVGSERAVLIGVSEGGPMCSLFAATYPERTEALVMIGSYARRLKDFDYPWAPTAEEHEAFFETMQSEWGKPVGLDVRAPSLIDDEEFRDWWAEYLRMGASPGAAVALTRMNAEIDVRCVLSSIRVPTLIIHRSGDQCLPVEGGRFMAALIRGCKYVELDGIDHLPFVGNQDEILDEIEQFLDGALHPCEKDRVLATAMCIRIAEPEQVGLTANEWDDLVERSGVFVRRQAEVFKGRGVCLDGKGMTALFDGPVRAIRCAFAIADSVRRFNLPFKTGLHIGECDIDGEMFSGFAVDLASAIADKAQFGDVMISRTIKDLVAGSGLEFDDAGIHTFDSVEGEWRLFTVIH